MDFWIELLFELFAAVIEAVFEEHLLPKCLRISFVTVFLGGLAALMVFLIFRFGWLAVQAILIITVVVLLSVLGYFIFRICRHGILLPARKQDLPEILRLYRSVIGKPGCNWSITYPNEITLQEGFHSKNLFVLRKGRTIIGAGSIVPQNELDDLKCWHFPMDAREIARIVIAEPYQGKGYGKHLVNQLCVKLKKANCQAVHLLVSTENRHALNLYRETGFFSRGSCHRYSHDYYAFERKL